MELLLFVTRYLIKFLDWSRINCSFICRIKICSFKLSSLHLLPWSHSVLFLVIFCIDVFLLVYFFSIDVFFSITADKLLSQSCFCFPWEIKSPSKYATSTPQTSQSVLVEKRWWLALPGEAAWPWGALPLAELSPGTHGCMQGRFGQLGCVSHPTKGVVGGLLFLFPGTTLLPIFCWGSPEVFATQLVQAVGAPSGTDVGKWNEKLWIVGTAETLVPSFTLEALMCFISDKAEFPTEIWFANGL